MRIGRVIIAICCLSCAPAWAQSYRLEPLASLTPDCEVAAYRFEDIDHNGCDDLLVIGRQGQILTWAGHADSEVHFDLAAQAWSLPDPKKSLLALAAWGLDDQDKVLMVLGSEGLVTHAVNADGSIDPNGVLVNQRMRNRFSVSWPVFSNFLQDMNQDGLMDVLVPGPGTCEIWINQGPSDDSSKVPTFSRMGTFPVEMKHYRSVDLDNAMGRLYEQVIVPGLLLKDINGDHVQDLIVKHDPKYDYYVVEPDGTIPDKPTVSLDLDLFQDTTPEAKGVPFGETLAIRGGPQIMEIDLNNDQIPDTVIFHRRKLWFFHGTKQGPQFSEPSAIIKSAEDVTVFLPCLFDEDEYPDLLMLKLKVPSITQLLGALFADWDIKIESAGYRSKQGQSFELSSNWQGEVYLKLPSILSLLTNMEQFENLGVDPKYESVVNGDFNGDGLLDVTMLNTETTQFEFWFGHPGLAEPEPLKADDPRQVGAKLRELFFAKTDNVWDLDRIEKALNALLSDQFFAATGGRAPDYRWPVPEGRTVAGIRPVDFQQDGKDELLIVQADPDHAHHRVFELYKVAGPRQ